MLKYILIYIGMTLLVACAGKGTDPANCLNSVKSRFPHARIYAEHVDEDFHFIVVDSASGMAFLAQTGNRDNANISVLTTLLRLDTAKGPTVIAGK